MLQLAEQTQHHIEKASYYTIYSFILQLFSQKNIDFF